MFKVGDRVEDGAGDRAEVLEVDRYGEIRLRYDSKEFDQGRWFYPSVIFKPVTEESDGPVRTVTRKEIVGGTYGDVMVGDVGPSAERVPICIPNRFYSADEIRAAIATLTEIAEALE